MNQPPQDPFYNGPAENANAGQPWPSPEPRPGGPGQPGYPRPQEQGSSPNYPPPGQPGYPQQGSVPNYPPTQLASSNIPGYPPQEAAPNYPPQPAPGTVPAYPSSGYPQPPTTYAPPPGPTSMPGYPPMQQGYPPQPGQFGAQTPQWPNYSQPGMPGSPQKSNSRIFIISCIVLLCVIIIGVLAAVLISTHNNPTANNNTPPPANTSSSPTASAPTPTAAATSGTTGSGGGAGTIGQPVQAGSNWQITVNGISTSSGDSITTPKPGDTFLVVDVTLKNISSSKQLVSSLLDFTLQDPSGGKFNESIIDLPPPPPDGDVPAGQTVEGKIPYEVPTSVHQFTFSFSYDFNGGAVSWNITQ